MTTTAPAPTAAGPVGAVAWPRIARLWLSPTIAVLAVGVGLALGWHGVDVAASTHRIHEFRQHGYGLWDASWYGGQWTLDYSLAFAPVASTIGLPAVALVSAAVATWSFQRIVDRHVEAVAAACAAGVVFALGNVVQTSIGQLPYLSGEAVGLAALALAARRWWLPAWVLALGTSLLSPLAGLFVAVAAGAWALNAAWDAVRARPAGVGGLFGVAPAAAKAPVGNAAAPTGAWPSVRIAIAAAAVAVAAGVPIVTTAVLFPGEGQMPFSLTDCAWDLAIAIAVGLATRRSERVLRTGIAIYAVALVGSWAVASPLGGNVGRLGDVMALPVATLALWSRRRVVLGFLAVPLVASSWVPAWGAMTSTHTAASTERSFYVPLDRWLHGVDPGGLEGRVEVVPTFSHWESVWVADAVPIARGWERQSDVTLNPIFYRTGRIGAGPYHRWLVANGVRWVALPHAPLDYAGVQEAKLVDAGVPGLTPVWHDRDWRVYRVDRSSGLVAGHATVVRMANSSIAVRTATAGTFTVRVRSNADWRVTSGSACLTTTPGGWIGLHTPTPETVNLDLSLTGPSAACRGS